ncbi:MAG: alpha/beta hydrolase [Clostridia bacterium]|jgi:pimeloyl-ACP methyl ester carboxylesterase
MNKIKVFKSDEGRDRIRKYYNGILSFFPFRQKYVDTSFGKTFVLEAGQPGYPALVLLHGSCSNSAMWLGDIPVLMSNFHVFAVDTLGEAGNSEETRLDIDTDEYTRWLSELLEKLDISQAVIMGNSMGGWLALHFAAAFPKRTSALVLLAPAGIVPARQSFLAKTANISEDPDSAASVKNAIFADTAVPKEVMEFMSLVMADFNPITGAFWVLSDEQMRNLTMPVLMIAGKDDITTDTKEAAKRLAKFVPHARIDLIEGSHVIINTAATVMPFLLMKENS